MLSPLTIDDPRYVKALSHPMRVRILAILQERTAGPVQLAEWLGGSLGSVSYHVRTLHQLGLIELVDETRVRGAIAHHYRARERARVTDEAWARATPIAKQVAVGATLQTVNAVASASAAAGGFDGGQAHLSRLALRLDAAAYEQLSKACTQLLEHADQLERDAAGRLKRRPHDEQVVDAGLVIMLFEATRVSDSTSASDGQHTGERAGSSRRRRSAHA